MDYYLEEPTIKKVKVSIEPCPCCGSQNLKMNKVSTGNGCDTFGGYAYIECQNCHHRVEKESNNIGWGDTLNGLFEMVRTTWNGQSARYRKKGSIKSDKILAWVERMRGLCLNSGVDFQDALDELVAIVGDKK